jgi:hypothetical protein
MSAALHILRRRESETSSAFAERLLGTAEALEMTLARAAYQY